jgi:hypothetical protein
MNRIRANEWEAVVHTQTDQDLEDLSKFADEEGLPEIHQMSSHRFYFSGQKEFILKLCAAVL